MNNWMTRCWEFENSCCCCCVVEGGVTIWSGDNKRVAAVWSEGREGGSCTSRQDFV